MKERQLHQNTYVIPTTIGVVCIKLSFLITILTLIIFKIDGELDNIGGMLARRVGVQVAQLIRDVQEKYNQFVIFYRTG